ASERSAFDAQCATAPERGEICLHNTFAPGYGAASQEIEQVGTLGGEGGVIVMNREGRPAFAMNTSGMYRGAVSSTAAARVAIYADEP
ncbi:MAG: hypothetical protein U1A07_26065, partial [Phenylobacterium sp.]|nr:hypothetical protein [Phenylobacterium sp.]